MYEFVEKHMPAGTMSFPAKENYPDPADWSAEPHASVYVCMDPECQEAAAEYIAEQVGQRGTFSLFAHYEEGE